MKIKKQRHTELTLNTSQKISPLLTQRLSAQGILRYFIRMSHISLGLFVVYPTTTLLHAAPTFGSAAWFAQAGAASAQPPQTRPNITQTTNPNVIGSVNNPQQAAQHTQRTMGDMSHTLQAIAAAQKAQSAASQLSIKTANNVANGLGVGGLEIAKNVGKDPNAWQNAKLPTQAVKDGKANVEIVQTDKKAILSWQKFDVGSNTVVHFDQKAGQQINGSNDWVALNRIYDANPSQIYGQIKAEGSVYLLNQNGFLFGGSSKINTHSFLASSLDLLDGDINQSNQRFLKEGLPKLNTKILLNGATYEDPNAIPQDKKLLSARGAITIDKGASINTGENGFNMLVAPKLSNHGTVNATRGQVILAAGTELFNQDRNDNKNNEMDVRIGDNAGLLTNTGLVQNSEGNITLLGKNIQQGGIVGTTTGITHTGSINIYAQENASGSLDASLSGRLDFEKDSITTILPSNNKETTTSSDEATKAVKPAELNFKAGSVLFQPNALVLAPSAKLNINTNFKKTSNDLWNKDNTTFQFPYYITPNLDYVAGRIWLAPKVTINVAGLPDVSASVADYMVKLPRIGLNELADSPLLRDSFLYTNTNVIVDSTQHGTRSDGLDWEGSPILNIKGYIEQIPRDIKQLQINGGIVNLVGNEIITQKDSLINIDGGYLHYKAGHTPSSTKLQGKDGQIYDIGEAEANFDYTGFAGQHLSEQERWGVKQSYINPLLSGQVATYRPAHIHGGNAGSLNLVFFNTAILDGNISAHAFAGLNQVLNSVQPKGGKLSINDYDTKYRFPSLSITPDQVNDLTTLIPDFDPTKNLYKNTTNYLQDLVFNGKWFVPTELVPENELNPNYWVRLNAKSFNDSGLSDIKLSAESNKIVVKKDADIKVQSGGKIDLNAVQVNVNGNLTAQAGEINIQASPFASDSTFGTTILSRDGDLSEISKTEIEIGENAKLDVHGKWVNDQGKTIEEIDGKQFMNAGSIVFINKANSFVVRANDGATQIVDATGDINIKKGSILDVSSGGYVTPENQLLIKNGTVQGRAGNLTVSNYVGWFKEPEVNSSLPNKPDKIPTQGKIRLDGEIRSSGFAGGGTLTLQALGIQIGDTEPTSKSDSSIEKQHDYEKLWLKPEFFSNLGFGAYNLKSIYDTTLSADSKIQLKQKTYIPNINNLLEAKTGTKISSPSFTQQGYLDDYHRLPTNLKLVAGLLNAGNGRVKYYDFEQKQLSSAVMLNKGSEIFADANAQIELVSTDQIAIEGKIKAPGGTIKLLSDTQKNGYSGLLGHDDTQNSFQAPDQAIWLGKESLLDVSGISVLNPLAKPQNINGVMKQPRTGKILAGGDVVISTDSGYIAASPTAQINVSGTHDHYDLLQDTKGVNHIQPTEVWSDAGSITLAAHKGLYFDGKLIAQAGGEKAKGGQLNIMALNSLDEYSQPKSPKSVVLSQSGEFAKLAGIRESGQTPTAPENTLYFAADRLKDSGIDYLNINADPKFDQIFEMGSAPIYTPIYFDGNVNLDVKGSIVLNTPKIIAVARQDKIKNQLVNPSELSTGFNDSGNSKVNLKAAYINLKGTQTSQLEAVKPIAARGNSIFNVNAKYIDLEGHLGLARFKDANFNSQMDIRLNGSLFTAAKSLTGSLYTPANLNFTAAQIYPASGNSFVLLANANVDSSEQAVDEQGKLINTKITIKGNGNKVPLPLSAGGKLLIDANYIEQGGVLRAPAGQLILGVNNPDDAAIKVEFQQLPLTKTSKLNILPNSISSVSLGDQGRIVPYGQTEDGRTWQYATVVENANSVELGNLPLPPEKKISLSAEAVNLQKGAQIDLSGGGELQAIEWISGTGGSRDLLSQNNIKYVNDAEGKKIATDVPLYPDERGVYAIIPSYQSPIAAYDPHFAMGQAAIEAGQQIYLTGSKDLPAGNYTLLPAKYATLPGAYRVVANSVRGSVKKQNVTLADGTQVMAGYWVDGLTGARDAVSSTFEIQSRPVWGQYSEYITTHADQFFAAQAKQAGTPSPLLMRDAGQLVLAATQSLDLGAKLNTAAGKDGSKARVDIASEAIQIVGNSKTKALDQHLQITTKELNDLNAGSLMLGGTRKQVKEGTQVDTLASSIVVQNDKNTALEAPEIILVSRPDINTTLQQKGIQINSGSVINAKGELAASNAKPLIFGEKATENTAAISGDGSMLRVSNAGYTTVNRHALPQDELGQSTAQGQLNIDAGASIHGGKSLTIDTSRYSKMDATAQLAGESIALNSGKVAITNDPSKAKDYDGLVIGQTSLEQFAKSNQLILSSYSTLDFLGNVNLKVNKALNLSAGTFKADQGSVNISADHLTLENNLNGTRLDQINTTDNKNSLNLNARHITFGQGDKNLKGFSTVNASAKENMDMVGRGQFDLGKTNTTLKTPVLIANQGADNTVKTTGTLNLQTQGAITKEVEALQPLGGKVVLTGSSINSNLKIRANSGQIDLNATKGDLKLNKDAVLDVSGIEKKFFDLDAYAPAGAINLQADQGYLNVANGATLDFSAHKNGGDAGQLSTVAGKAIQLLGTLKGNAAKGKGSSLRFDSGQAVDLNQLAQQMASSGINRSIDITTHQGNLNLTKDQKLVAQEIKLTADGGQGNSAKGLELNHGNVNIDGVIDASSKTQGQAGGTITLSAKSAINVNGQLLVSTTDKQKRGGTVNLNTIGKPNGTLNKDYGYQNVDAADSGRIQIGQNAVIDVSGGTDRGLSDGTVNIRAPLLSNGDIAVNIAPKAQIKGARDVAVNAYAVWSTTDKNTDASKHFDGIIDPAGWYDRHGKLVAGTFIDQKGETVGSNAGLTDEQIDEYLTKYTFVPDAANKDHQSFYGYVDGDANQAQAGTLMGFVQKPKFAFESRLSGVKNLSVRPEIELNNPDKNINYGDITVATPWNLAAGKSHRGEVTKLDYRYKDQAPTLNLNAENDVNLNASISDGFFQFENLSRSNIKNSTFNEAKIKFNKTLSNIEQAKINAGGTYEIELHKAYELFKDQNPYVVAQYYGVYQDYLDVLAVDPITTASLYVQIKSQYNPNGKADAESGIVAPTVPTDLADYPAYLISWKKYINEIKTLYNSTFMPIQVEMLAPPPTQLSEIKPNLNNTPSPISTADNPLPMQAANLLGGASSSYRISAGRDFNSSSPTNVQTLHKDGDVQLQGHTEYEYAAKDRKIMSPTVLRTGTGQIDINATQNLNLNDDVAPGVIYTAGQPKQGVAQTYSANIRTYNSNYIDYQNIVVTSAVNPETAGDIHIAVGQDIMGNEHYKDQDGRVSGELDRSLAQHWWEWMQTGNPYQETDKNVKIANSSSINFANFAQGIMSVGGDVDISAGRDIQELSVSLPTTWHFTAPDRKNYAVLGGGDLNLNVGRDLLSGQYFVSKGLGNINVGGAIKSSDLLTGNNKASTVLALQDAKLNITAKQDIDIAHVFNPSYLFGFGNQDSAQPFFNGFSTIDLQPYSTRSTVNLNSIAGDIQFNTLSKTSPFYGATTTNYVSFAGDDVLPANLNFIALAGSTQLNSGGILFPSQNGNLQLIAEKDIRFIDSLNRNDQLRMSDFVVDNIGDDVLPSPLQQVNRNHDAISKFPENSSSSNISAGSTLHALDKMPARIYSLNGSIINGVEKANTGTWTQRLKLQLPKLAQIYAGKDIQNLVFYGQNLHQSDTTRIVAGQSIVNTPLAWTSSNLPVIILGGVGTLEVIAGQDIGPLTNPVSANKEIGGDNSNSDFGILTIGNRDNHALSTEGANLNIKFGIAPGIKTQAFIDKYIAPTATTTELPNFSEDLVKFMQEYENGQQLNTGLVKDRVLKPLSKEQAWTDFQKLSLERKQLFVDQVFNKILTTTAKDYNDPKSDNFQKYARGYEAINTLYPAELGYTKNNLSGGASGATETVNTGNLDMRNTTLQTQQGGNITISAPGGELLVGSIAAPPADKPSASGIIAAGKGDVNIFSDRSVLLAQSRIFALQGGDMMIWSSNGDINAGKGAKTTSELAQANYVCNVDHYCTLNPISGVSGAGIAALQTQPNEEAGDTFLVAPRGTVDAGDAGIRVGGTFM
ncbi:filamentous haemagglutinin family protein [Acinetobacter sp. CFCC 10889]|uniref:filamentous haemagglutinin family protein n=1 Tax=Acinetobacter sp. CFCC 10889 TaxID=1775557 RepID=UPI0013A6B332|nr:filamentous haemagglutinin family protein [Acinetobacter sp. CFCC 10889]